MHYIAGSENFIQRIKYSENVPDNLSPSNAYSHSDAIYLKEMSNL